MQLKDKIPVPPMDELRVARLERSIVAQVEALPAPAPAVGHSFFRYGIAAIAVAGVLLAIALNLRGAQLGEGAVAMIPPVQQVAQMQEPMEVVTGEGQTTQLSLGDAQIEVGENTEISVQRYSDGRVNLQLRSGAVHCQVDPKLNRPAFVVQSGDVKVTVIGTEFDVYRSELVRVSVTRGTVGVESGSESFLLTKGQSWQGSPQDKVALATILKQREEKLREEEEMVVRTHAAHPKLRRDRKHRARSPKPKAKDSSGKNDSQSEDVHSFPRQVLGVKPSRPNLSQGVDASLASLAASNPKQAAEELGKLVVQRKGRQASFALYSQAYLLQFRLGKSQAAARAVLHYTRRFPKGAEIENILWMAVQIRCADGNSSQCRSAAHSYLWRFPKGRFGSAASKIVNTPL